MRQRALSQPVFPPLDALAPTPSHSKTFSEPNASPLSRRTSTTTECDSSRSGDSSSYLGGRMTGRSSIASSSSSESTHDGGDRAAAASRRHHHADQPVAPVPSSGGLEQSSTGTTVGPVSRSRSPLILSLIQQFDGSISSRIVDLARSPPPVLQHQHGFDKASTKGAWTRATGTGASSSARVFWSDESRAASPEEEAPDAADETILSVEEMERMISRLPRGAGRRSLAAPLSSYSSRDASGSLRSILRATSDANTTSTTSTTDDDPATSKRTRAVSFSSVVAIREHGRVQGGSTSVTRSGGFSLGLDWHVERELVAPIDVSIETAATTRTSRTTSNAHHQREEEQRLMTESDTWLDLDGHVIPLPADDGSPTSSLARSSNPTPPPTSTSPFDEVSIEDYLLQPLKLHKRYPSSNKSEELARIGEEGRLALFQRYAGVEGDDQRDHPSFRDLLVSDVDERVELDAIRQSRSGHFCSCVPPRGRSRSMLVDTSTFDIASLPLSTTNTCCTDERCPCVRDGVGCHVESDHYCRCQGRFTEMKERTRRQKHDDDDSENDHDHDDDEEEADDDDGDRSNFDECDDEPDSPRPPPLVQAGCLNPSGRYQFDDRAGRDHASRFLYGADPYDEVGDIVGPAPTARRVLVSPPIRFSRVRTLSALPM